MNIYHLFKSFQIHIFYLYRYLRRLAIYHKNINVENIQIKKNSKFLKSTLTQ